MRRDRNGVPMPGHAALSSGRRRNRTRTIARACALAGSTAAVLFIAGCGGQAEAPAILIVNASVIDGTGAPARSVAVRIRGDRIIEVGELEPTAADSVVDAGGLTLAPGFIDAHSHADFAVIHEGDSVGQVILVTDRRDVIRAVSQGITTGVIGQDGQSPYPLSILVDTLDAVGGIAIQPGVVHRPRKPPLRSHGPRLPPAGHSR